MNKRPNVLLIIADDHRHNAIHAFGDPIVQTPTLDALAEGGVSFRRTHIMGGLSGAVCVPTRACLHTGANVFRATPLYNEGGYGSMRILNPELPLLGETLRQAGYHTFGTGKWHNDEASFARSFESGANIFFGGMSDHLQVPLHDFDPNGVYAAEDRYMGDGFSTELFSDAAIQFLQEYNQDNPFFLYLSFTSPHDPRMAPPPYANMYDPDAIPLPENFMSEHPFDNGDMRLRDEMLAPFPRTPEIVRQHMADYYAMITHHDAHMQRVVDALQASGHADNTIIVYIADHGLSVGQHGLLGKQNMYDHSVRIPLIFNGPGLPANLEVDALNYQYDVYPTLCDLLGLPIPETVEGKSLMPLVNGEQETLYDNVYSLYRDIQRMVTTGEWKLIRYHQAQNAKGATVGIDRIQLFNLLDDPWETNDLSEDPVQRERITELTRALERWQERVDDPLNRNG